MWDAGVNEYSTKSDIVYSLLKKKILEGALHPRERLVVANIAQDFHVSPMPVREALQRLHQEDLIEMIPHMGARVKVIDIESFKDMTIIRNALEPLAAKLAASRMTDAQIETLFDIVDKMEICAEGRDIERYTKLNQEFHDYIHKSCGNQALIDIIQNLEEKTLRSKGVFYRNPDSMKQSTKEHRKIAEAFRSRNDQQVYENTRIHEETCFRLVTQLLESDLGEA